jgi:hypothetical protein
MQGVVAIVVPLRIEAVTQQVRGVVLVLQHQMHLALLRHCRAHARRQFPEKIVIVDGVHGVQAQAVDAVIQQPHQGVFAEEITYLRAAEIDGRTPGRDALFMKELPRIHTQIIAVRAEVVVDHIHEHHQAIGMGGVDQLLEFVGGAVGVGRGEGKNAVVAPVARSGEGIEGHQLQGGDAEVGQVRQMLDNLLEAAEQTDMQLVQHRLVPGAAIPLVVAPGVGRMVDYLAETMHVLDLTARGRVRYRPLPVDAVAIAGIGRTAQQRHEPAVLLRLHRLQAIVL